MIKINFPAPELKYDRVRGGRERGSRRKVRTGTGGGRGGYEFSCFFFHTFEPLTYYLHSKEREREDFFLNSYIKKLDDWTTAQRMGVYSIVVYSISWISSLL